MPDKGAYLGRQPGGGVLPVDMPDEGAYLGRQPGGGVPPLLQCARGEIIGLVTNFLLVGHSFLT
jgi:hypothetical protein